MNGLKWKRLACMLVLLLPALFAAVPAGNAEGAPKHTKYAEGEALVVLKNSTGQKLKASAFSSGGTGQSRVQSVAKSARASAVKTYSALSEAADAILVHMKSDTQTTEELIAELNRNPEVLSAAPNYYKKLSRTPNDPDYVNGKLWGLTRIRADEAWDTTTGNADITIAVIDTGVDPTHPDLKDNLDMVRSRDFAGEGIEDIVGHGTHVIGTIGAVGDNGIGVTGVNWRVKILPLQAFMGTLVDSAIMNALNYLVDLQENGGVRIHAVNLSLGGWEMGSPESVKNSAMYLAYKALDETDKTVIVVAAGNEGQEVGEPAKYNDPQSEVLIGAYIYPPSYTGLNNMIVVGAIGPDDKGADFSNWSSTAVDIAAPGVDIWSTVPGKQGSYGSLQGTSMAAPLVTGAVGLLAARNPSLTAFDLKRLLLDNANGKVNPPPEKLYPHYVWPSNARLSRYGLLDVKAALDNRAGSIVPVEAVSLTPATATLKIGERRQFTASVSPSNATDQKVVWRSSAPSVAEVDTAGMVQAVNTGNAEITVTTSEGGFSKTAKISVIPASNSSSGGGGGGCDAGWGFAALAGALLAFILAKNIFIVN
jgi:subtilisin family serine protease